MPINYYTFGTRDDLEFIHAALPVDEVLGGLAEEAAELAQAAEKMRRKISGINPSPKTFEQCYKDLAEELCDVVNCIEVLETYKGLRAIGELGMEPAFKLRRWRNRLVDAFSNRTGEDDGFQDAYK